MWHGRPRPRTSSVRVARRASARKKATVKGGLQDHRQRQSDLRLIHGRKSFPFYFSHDLLTIWTSVMVM